MSPEGLRFLAAAKDTREPTIMKVCGHRGLEFRAWGLGFRKTFGFGVVCRMKSGLRRE